MSEEASGESRQVISIDEIREMQKKGIAELLNYGGVVNFFAVIDDRSYKLEGANYVYLPLLGFPEPNVPL